MPTPAPPIQLGGFDNVPDTRSLIKSDWAQDVTVRAVNPFTDEAQRTANWPTPPNGALSTLGVDGIVEVYRQGEWRELIDTDTVVPASPDGLAESGKAMGFLKFMQQPMREFVGFADVNMLEYDPNYTGPVRGTFTAHTPVATPACLITIGAPTGVIPHLYRGMVFGATTGHVGGDEVVVTKGESNTVVAAIPPAVPDAGGFFSIDFSTAPLDLPEGPWRLHLYRGGIAQTPWPQIPLFTNTTVQLHVITDTDYPLFSIPADTTGEFYFPVSGIGDKRVAVYKGTDLMGEACPVPALLRSYITAGFPGDATMFETTSYVYDHALAVIAAVRMGDSKFADDLYRGLMKHKDSAGRFRFVRQQEGTAQGDLFMRTGAHAWAVYAWLKYLSARPELVARDKPAVMQSIAYMMGLVSGAGPTSGLILGGSGIYIPDGGGGQTFDPDYIIPWASTEHNVDAYWVLKCAAAVLDEPSYLTTMNTLSDVMYAKLWAGTRLLQGIQPTGDDDADALDLHTWGAIWLLDAGYTDEAYTNFAGADACKFTIDGVTGYNISYDHIGYPGMLPNIWAEGTFGWVCAARILNIPYLSILTGMLDWQRADGSWPYVMVEDAAYELYPYPSSISAGWVVPAIVGGGLWDD